MIYIVDSHYFPSFNLFKELSDSTNCIIEQYVPHRKLSFRNRCTLPGANGAIHLSIPLQNGRDQKTLMKEVKIANRENWQARHWKTITACYNRSPWFEYFRDGLSRLYLKKTDYLVDWNRDCLQWAAGNLSLDTRISFTEAYQSTYPEDGYTDLRSGPLSVPERENKSFSPEDRYTQVFEERLGFLPNLSILDRMFCDGVKGWIRKK